MLFNLIKSQPAYYADGYELYFTTDTTDTDVANAAFGIGTKYLSYDHPDRFFASAYHIETCAADRGVFIKIGIPFLD